MLGKRYSLGSVFEPTGEPLVKVANFKELAQQSEDIKSFLATFKPDPGYMYLHVIAVGAGEYWGRNINSDYFREDDLLNRYKTFETDASVFSEHANKPYDKHYGKVAFAWYNLPMHRVELIIAIDKIAGKEFVDRVERGEQLCVSMGCFPAGTDILLADNTFKHIEDVVPGDKVITHTGETHEVTTKMLHEHTGNMCKIRSYGAQDLLCTDNHPILVRNYYNYIQNRSGICPVCKNSFKNVKEHFKELKECNPLYIEHKDFYTKSTTTDFGYEYSEYWKEAKDILPYEYLVTPIFNNKINKQKKLTKYREAFYSLLGYFLAEGNYQKYGKNISGLLFTFHKDEIYFHNEVLKYLSIVSKKTPHIRYRKDNTALIQLSDKTLANKFYKLIGEYSYGKYISEKLIKDTSEKEKILILGKFIDGDGYYSKCSNCLYFCTVSRDLAFGLQRLAADASIAITITERRKKAKVTHHRQQYLGYVSQPNTYLLKSASQKALKYIDTKHYTSLPNIFAKDGFLCKRVKSIETYHVDNLPVYNLSVEGDESYTANSVAVHNCRVKFDECSICGNHASKPSDYCNHLKYHKGEIFPDGKQAYMINPNPTFFDISIVRRPAWKPAFCLAKVASVDTNVNTMSIQEKNALAFEELDSLIPMEKTAEVWEIPEDDELLGAKVLAKHSSVQKVALDKQMPAISVQDIDAEIRDMLPAINKLEPDLPAPLLDDLARKYEIKDILHSFASAAIPMKPQEFTRIVIVKNNLPLEAFGTVMTGILGSFHGNGKAGSGNTEVATPNILPGISLPEIMEKLAPFIHARSAILEDVLSRLNKIFDTEELQKLGLNKTAAVLYQPNPVLDSLDISPRMNFGYVRRVPEFQDPNRGLGKDSVLLQDPFNLSTMPIAISRESLAQEIRNPSISDYSRNQLLALGALQGKDFSAFKDPKIINSVIHEPGFLSSLALLINSFRAKSSVHKMRLDTKSILNNVSLEHLTNAYNPVPRIISQEYYTRY